MKKEHIISEKNHNLFIFLSTFFIANALLAEFIGVKILSLEKILSINPVNIPFIGDSFLSLNMSVGVIIWPIVFIISDIINEYYGRKGVQKISLIAALLILYSFIIVLFSTESPPADFWLENNSVDSSGNAFNINFAYNSIFRQGMGIIVGSITAFLVGQFVDAYTFHYLRILTNHKWLWIRATGSTVVSQLVDSFLILFIAFYLLGNWSFIEVISVGLIQYFYKIFIAIVLTPVIYWMHIVIDKYLGKERVKEMIEKATTA